MRLNVKMAQDEILKFLQKNKGKMLTIREIKDANIMANSSNIARQVNQLCKFGFVDYEYDYEFKSKRYFVNEN